MIRFLLFMSLALVAVSACPNATVIPPNNPICVPVGQFSAQIGTCDAVQTTISDLYYASSSACIDQSASPVVAYLSYGGQCDVFGQLRTCNASATPFPRGLPITTLTGGSIVTFYPAGQTCSASYNAMAVQIQAGSGQCAPTHPGEGLHGDFRKVDCSNPAYPVELIYTDGTCTTLVTNSSYVSDTCKNDRTIQCVVATPAGSGASGLGLSAYLLALASLVALALL